MQICIFEYKFISFDFYSILFTIIMLVQNTTNFLSIAGFIEAAQGKPIAQVKLRKVDNHLKNIELSYEAKKPRYNKVFCLLLTVSYKTSSLIDFYRISAKYNVSAMFFSLFMSHAFRLQILLCDQTRTPSNRLLEVV